MIDAEELKYRDLETQGMLDESSQKNMNTQKRIVEKKFTWLDWSIEHAEIFQDSDIVERIQLYGFETPDEPNNWAVDENEGADQVAEPLASVLASVLVKPGHKDNLWVIGNGDIGETEGLLDALVQAQFVECHLWLEDQAVCKLLV
jgi:hypothetical protein